MKKAVWFLLPIYILYAGVVYYVTLPPLNWHAPEFWEYLFYVLGPVLILTIFFTVSKRSVSAIDNLKRMFLHQPTNPNMAGNNSNKKATMLFKCCVGLLVFMIGFPFIANIVTSKIFHAKSYAQRIDVQNVGFEEIPEVDFKKTPIIDRDSSIRLGDKVMGNMSEWVSQFDVSTEYTQISYLDSVYRVTPLTYTGFIKYMKNRDNGVPAYITVDSTDGKTSLVKLKDIGLEGMRYVPSAYFNENLMRHLRFQHPTEIFGDPSFEIDEEGRPWYICTTYTYSGVGSKKSVTGAIFLDPITGESTKYDASDIPAWADRIYPENLVVEQVDENGSLQDGFINSMIGQNGVTVTSQGYNYLAKDGDIWLYSGITSANADESNLGFVLVNLRTHEAMKIATAGANETSAMNSAASEVKNYGYQSTFPLLINIQGNPVYLMSLKDNGLIKMYATVSAVDYQKVSTVYSDEGLDSLLKKTTTLLGSSDVVNEDTLKTASILVKKVERVNFEGTTIYYILTDSDEKYKITFTAKYEDQLAFLKEGDTLSVSYVDSEGFKTIREIK